MFKFVRKFPGMTVKEILHAQFRAEPEKVAMEYGTTKITYRELEFITHAVAQRLQNDYGIGPGVCVAIYPDFTVAEFISQLSVLLAEGYFLSLNPTDIMEARQKIQVLGRVGVFMCSSDKVAEVQKLEIDIPTFTQTAALIADRQQLPAELCPLRPASLSPQDVCRMMFTSGSTGVPKAVAWSNEAQGFVYECLTTFGEQSSDGRTMLMKGFLSPGLLLETMFTRATVVIPEPDADLSKLLVSANITLTRLTPSQLAVLAIPPVPLPNLRIGLAGEKCPQHLLDAWLPMIRDVEDTYGQTEGVVFLRHVTQFHRPGLSSIAPVHIFDENLEPVPKGEPGELCVKTVGPTSYWNAPELTAKKWISDPSGNGVLCRTGDLAKELPDGTIEIVGRIDNMVKLRGQRLELEPIEDCVMKVSFVRQCAVVMVNSVLDDHQNRPELARLDAFVVLTDAGKNMPRQQLEKLITEQTSRDLPARARPSRIHVIDQMPSINGKTHRRALKDLAQNAPLSSTGETKAKTELEQTVMTTVCTVLGLSHVGLQDNLFEFGCNSLTVVMLLGRLVTSTGCRLSVADFFAEPTVAGIVRTIRKERSETSPASSTADWIQNTTFCLHFLLMLCMLIPHQFESGAKFLRDVNLRPYFLQDSIPNLYPHLTIVLVSGIRESLDARPTLVVLKNTVVSQVLLVVLVFAAAIVVPVGLLGHLSVFQSLNHAGHLWLLTSMALARILHALCVFFRLPEVILLICCLALNASEIMLNKGLKDTEFFAPGNSLFLEVAKYMILKLNGVWFRTWTLFQLGVFLGRGLQIVDGRISRSMRRAFALGVVAVMVSGAGQLSELQKAVLIVLAGVNILPTTVNVVSVAGRGMFVSFLFQFLLPSYSILPVRQAVHFVASNCTAWVLPWLVFVVGMFLEGVVLSVLGVVFFVQDLKRHARIACKLLGILLFVGMPFSALSLYYGELPNTEVAYVTAIAGQRPWEISHSDVKSLILQGASIDVFHLTATGGCGLVSISSGRLECEKFSSSSSSVWNFDPTKLMKEVPSNDDCIAMGGPIQSNRSFSPGHSCLARAVYNTTADFVWAESLLFPRLPQLTRKDLECYARRYPDLLDRHADQITDEQAMVLTTHWNEFGIFELRDPYCRGLSERELVCYLERYPDLRMAFGDNLNRAQKHWEESGEKEGRKATCD